MQENPLNIFRNTVIIMVITSTRGKPYVNSLADLPYIPPNRACELSKRLTSLF